MYIFECVSHIYLSIYLKQLNTHRRRFVVHAHRESLEGLHVHREVIYGYR